MKYVTYLLVSVLLISGLAFIPHKGDHPTLEIGAKAPMTDNKMKDISGSEIALQDKMSKNGLLVIFSCNTCPFVVGRQDSEGWERRYNDIAAAATKAGVGTILINSNEAKREKGDAFEDMISHAKEQGYTMSYVLDRNHAMADAFGARTTPHVFLFDKEYKLVYKGAIDDNNDAAADVKTPWLKDALSNLSSGNSIDPNSTRAIGCSIKRVKPEAK